MSIDWSNSSSASSQITKLTESDLPSSFSKKEEEQEDETLFLEKKIMKWLNENQIFMSIPEEKEFKYFEEARTNFCNNTAELNESSKSSMLNINLSLQKRRNSLPSLDIPKLVINPLKLSKFQTMKILEVKKENVEEK